MNRLSVLFLLICVLGCQSAIFRLYTRGSAKEFLFRDNAINFKDSKFDGNKKTVMIIHGYNEDALRPWVTRLRSALLQQEDMNVITMDWSDKAGGWYFQITKNSRTAGRQAGDLLHHLVTQAPSSRKLLHIVGFSLGAHAAGFCGRHLDKQYGMKPDRITGLDPAGPDFWRKQPEDRLDKQDADFVDIIHTDGGFLGLTNNIGHIDFYPNGGKHQPDCHYKGDLTDWLGCDHMRCPEYFTESVTNPLAFPAYGCANSDDFDRGRCIHCSSAQCPTMGYHADRTRGQASGKHYLYTHSTSPFSGSHNYLLTVKTGTKWFSGITGLIKIYVKLTGSSGESGEVKLRSRGVSGGSKEGYIVLAPKDLGSLQSIQMRGSKYDQWYVQYVVAKPLWTNQQYSACFKKWISSSTVTKTFSAGHKSC